ncbi:hypothetical protein [Pueribacillus theae]|nr:hypothetical protein [Pueribacillus theae]
MYKVTYSFKLNVNRHTLERKVTFRELLPIIRNKFYRIEKVTKI